MKILHVSQGYFPAAGGTEWLMTRLSEQLVSQFQDVVTVLTTNCYGGDAFYKPGVQVMPVGKEIIAGVEVHRLTVARSVSFGFHTVQYMLRKLRLPIPTAVRTIGDGPLIPGLQKAIRNFPVELIGVSSFPLAHMYETQKAAIEAHRPCILIGGLHPEDKIRFDQPRIYKSIRMADHYISYTDYETRFVISKGASPDRVSTIGLGVDPEPFQKIERAEARQRLGFDDFPVVGYIGQIVPHKGIDTLIRAMPRVWQSSPDVHLVIAGAKRPYADEIERMVTQWPGEWREKVLYRYDFSSQEKPWLFNALDIFTYPSAYESFGIAFLEAWACQLPVIGCRMGAVPSVIHEGEDGLLVDYQDDAGLANEIISLISQPEMAKRLGQTGYQKVLAHHTWPIVAAHFREVYSSTLERYNAKQPG